VFWRTCRGSLRRSGRPSIPLRGADLRGKIFIDRLPSVAAPFAHSTDRMSQIHRAVAFVAGGEPNSRPAVRIGMPESADTLLRHIRLATDSSKGPCQGRSASPRV
jgi:hypothetical protein